jgi:hypothetical protein
VALLDGKSLQRSRAQPRRSESQRGIECRGGKVAAGGAEGVVAYPLEERERRVAALRGVGQPCRDHPALENRQRARIGTRADDLARHGGESAGSAGVAAQIVEQEVAHLPHPAGDERRLAPVERLAHHGVADDALVMERQLELAPPGLRERRLRLRNPGGFRKSRLGVQRLERRFPRPASSEEEEGAEEHRDHGEQHGCRERRSFLGKPILDGRRTRCGRGSGCRHLRRCGLLGRGRRGRLEVRRIAHREVDRLDGHFAWNAEDPQSLRDQILHLGAECRGELPVQHQRCVHLAQHRRGGLTGRIEPRLRAGHLLVLDPSLDGEEHALLGAERPEEIRDLAPRAVLRLALDPRGRGQCHSQNEQDRHGHSTRMTTRRLASRRSSTFPCTSRGRVSA